MKLTEKKLFEYFDGTLLDTEHEYFRQKINSSPQLQADLMKYEKVKQLIDETRTVKTDEYYFGKIIPQFRSKINHRSGFFIPKFAYVFAVSVAAFFISLSVWSISSPVPSGNKIADDNSLSFLDLYSSSANDYTVPDDLTAEADSLINKEIRNELLASSGNTGDYLPNDYYSLVNSLSEQEADLVYHELLSKDLH